MLQFQQDTVRVEAQTWCGVALVMEGTMQRLSTPSIFNSTFGPEEEGPSYDKPSEGFLILGMFVTMTVMVVGSLGNLLTLFTLGHQFYMPRKAR